MVTQARHGCQSNKTLYSLIQLHPLLLAPDFFASSYRCSLKMSIHHHLHTILPRPFRLTHACSVYLVSMFICRDVLIQNGLFPSAYPAIWSSRLSKFDLSFFVAAATVYNHSLNGSAFLFSTTTAQARNARHAQDCMSITCELVKSFLLLLLDVSFKQDRGNPSAVPADLDLRGA